MSSGHIVPDSVMKIKMTDKYSAPGCMCLPSTYCKGPDSTVPKIEVDDFNKAQNAWGI